MKPVKIGGDQKMQRECVSTFSDLFLLPVDNCVLSFGLSQTFHVSSWQQEPEKIEFFEENEVQFLAVKVSRTTRSLNCLIENFCEYAYCATSPGSEDRRCPRIYAPVAAQGSCLNSQPQ